MRGGNVPVRERRRLVVVHAGVDAERDLLHRLREPQIRGSGEGGVLAEGHERVDAAPAHVGGERAERSALMNRIQLERRGVEDRATDVAERGVHRVRERVDRGRLRLARDDDRAARMGAKVARDRPRPCGVLPALGRPAGAELRGDRSRERLELRGRHGETVVRDGPRGRRHRLGDVETVHLRLARPDAAPVHEVPRLPHRGPAPEGEVGSEREDHVRLAEAVDRVERLAERGARPFARTLAPVGLPCVPDRARIALPQKAHLLAEARGRHRPRQDAEPLAAARPQRLEARLKRRGECVPRGDFAERADRGRTVGIVEREDGGLGPVIRRAEARRVLGVSFDLGRATHVALDEQAECRALHLHRGRVEERLARDDLFRSLDVGNDRLGGRSARGDPAHGERGAHQPEEVAAVHALTEVRGLAGELAAQDFLEGRILLELLEGAPVLRSRSLAEARAERGEIEVLILVGHS